MADLPFLTGWWRGLGLLPNTFAVECFMDEVAVAAGVDPIELRLRHLPEGSIGERLRAVLLAVADRAGWNTPAPAGRARGVACCADYGTVVANVAEVSVEGGQIRVHKVTAVVDPGVIINPNGVAAQVEGNVVMGVSSALLEETTVVDGVLSPANFGAYRILPMSATPQIEVVLLQGDDKPNGIGEPPIGPVAPAVANAVYALTGQPPAPAAAAADVGRAARRAAQGAPSRRVTTCRADYCVCATSVSRCPELARSCERSSRHWAEQDEGATGLVRAGFGRCLHA